MPAAVSTVVGGHGGGEPVRRDAGGGGTLLAATLTRDPLLVSGLVVAHGLPWLVLTLLAGVLVDRVDRRRLLVVANAARAVAVGLLAVATATGTAGVVVLYVAVFLVGAAETVVDNASLAVLPRLVGRERLDYANGRIFATQSVLNELIGPPVGAALFAVAATAAMATGSAVFAVAAFAMFLLPRRAGRSDVDAGGQLTGAGIGAQLVEGLRYFWASRLLRVVAVMAGVGNLFAAATGGVLVLLVTGEFGLSPAQYGVFLAAGAAGGISAGLVSERVVARLGAGPVIFLSIMLPAASYVVFVVSDSAWAGGAALAVDSFAGTVGSVVVTTLRQASVPEHLLGRVTSAYRMIALGAVPVGGLLGGALASAFGLRAPFLVGAIALAVFAVVLAPVLTTRRLDAAIGRGVREGTP